MKIEKGKKEIIEYSYKCDICGREPGSIRACNICSRDICSTCARFDPRDIGDYPQIYCLDCYNTGKKYLEQIAAEEQRCENIVEEFENKWRDEAIKNIEENRHHQLNTMNQ